MEAKRSYGESNENGELRRADGSQGELLLNLQGASYVLGRFSSLTLYRHEILTFQLKNEKEFRFEHIAYAYLLKTELFFIFKLES